jgi:predicted transcriptional regulator
VTIEVDGKKRRVGIRYSEEFIPPYEVIADPDYEEQAWKVVDGVYERARKLHELEAKKAANDNKPQPKAAPTIITAAELQHREFEPLKWVVPGYVPEGFTLLSGRPKIGKSWLNLDIALGVARGSTCLGSIQCERGDVLYLALEDNERRLKSRIDKLTGVIVTAGSTAIGREEWPANLHLTPQWPRADAGGLKLIEDWIDSHPATRLVIVDVLAMFRAAANRSSAYEQDYTAIKGLQDIASRRRLGIIGTHHNRKSASESGDPFDLVSGTLGMTGGADAGLILDRSSQGTTLYVRGRDIDEKESAVMFDKLSCRWRVLGEASEVRRSDERMKILDFLKDAAEPVAPTRIAAGTGMSLKGIERLLAKMVAAGEIEKAGRRRYIHASGVGASPTP